MSIGSIAWYNSKRPVGWQDQERPDIVPEIRHLVEIKYASPETLVET